MSSTHLNVGVFLEPGHLARVYFSVSSVHGTSSRPVTVMPVSDGLDELVESVAAWLEAQGSIALGQENLPGFPPGQ